MDYPKLRYGLEASPIEHQGQRMILLQDRMGYSDGSLLVNPQFAELLMLMNGKNSIRDLQVHYMRRTSELLYMEQLHEMLKMLDEHLFLENEHFIQAAAQEVARFRQDPVRRMQLAEKSYPKDPEALRDHLESFFLEAAEPLIPASDAEAQPQVLGLVSPHIDIEAGGACFAHAYKSLSRSVSPEAWVILGTGHEQVDNYFSLTSKDFETPLGLLRCDYDFCTELLQRAPRDLSASEYNHRREHSVEFQAVFLSYVQPDALIVPLLCSFSLDDWRTERTYIDEVADLLFNLAMKRSDRRVGFIASVDLAHIGPRYGDRFLPHEGTVTQNLLSDRELLESLEQCNATEFMERIIKENNSRRICGMAPLYVLAKILDGRAHGVVLNHTYTTVDSQNSFVTFASMAFYKTSEADSISGGNATTLSM